MMLITVIVQAIGCLLLVDFLSGLIHWLLDGYFREEWPIVGKWVVQPNSLHHRQPGAFLKNNWLESATGPLALGIVVLLIAHWLHVRGWQMWLMFFLGINTNEIHKWAHRNPRVNGPLITFLQRIGILQSQRHHAQHHRGRQDRFYCAVTNYLNPILESIRLWDVLDAFMVRGLRIRRRAE